MQGILLSLYPRSWRAQYGEEYQVLLNEVGITPATVFDIAKSALCLQVRIHAQALATALVLVQCSVGLLLSLQFNITDNLLWPPSNPLRAAGLVATYAPLVYMMRRWSGSFVSRIRAK